MMTKEQINNPINFPCRCGFTNKGRWKPKYIYEISDLRGDNCMHKIICKICGKTKHLAGD